MSTEMAQGKNLVLFGLAVVTLAAILHAYQMVLEFRIIEDAPHADRFFVQLQIFLLFALLLTAVGLAVRRRAALLCSVLGLICVLLGHIGWFLHSHRLLQAINEDRSYERPPPELIPPNLWGFVGARWWDVVLLILFIALFVWEIKVLFTRADKRNRNEMGS